MDSISFFRTSQAPSVQPSSVDQKASPLFSRVPKRNWVIGAVSAATLLIAYVAFRYLNVDSSGVSGVKEGAEEKCKQLFGHHRPEDLEGLSTLLKKANMFTEENCAALDSTLRTYIGSMNRIEIGIERIVDANVTITPEIFDKLLKGLYSDELGFAIAELQRANISISHEYLELLTEDNSSIARGIWKLFRENEDSSETISHILGLLHLNEMLMKENCDALLGAPKDVKFEKILETMKCMQEEASLNEENFRSFLADNRSLMKAARLGDLKGVKIILGNSKINVNYQAPRIQGRDDFGPTALMMAARNGHKEIVELLLKEGADPNILDPSEIMNSEYDVIGDTNGETALMWAVERGHKEIVELLLNANADPNIQDHYGNTALIFAAKNGCAEIVKMLIEKGAKPDIKRNKFDLSVKLQDDWTALMMAARNGHKEIVELLLKVKADPNIKDQYGNAALILAAYRDQPDIVRLLLKANADPNVQNNEGVGALIRAAYLGYTDIVTELLGVNVDLNVKNSFGITALMWAAQKDFKKIVNLLLNAKADPNIQSIDGYTALILAVDQGHKDVDVVRLLVDATANLNAQTVKGGHTALMIAAQVGHKEVVKLLLDAGADSDIKDRDRATVLSSYYCRTDDIRQLINDHRNARRTSV